ncbi:MAG: calcium/sodium antiporter [Saprospiraceae bacterium]|nr:calcium/sodium antiporter [Saprospiraceae bacterium]MCB9312200.1 calcium/sodium antiporter [Lewinellaceae bacterium]
MLMFILFVVGLVLVIKGADWLVEGAGSLAREFGVSDLVVGLTIVSFGTSLPELIVNLLASFQGSSELAIGNVLGSNIANILLILGAAALVGNLPVKRPTVLSEIPFSLAAALLVGFLANTTLFNPGAGMGIDRPEGVIILFFFLLFLVYILDLAKQDRSILGKSPEATGKGVTSKQIIQIGAGTIGLFIGGKWVVDGAIEMATAMGMSEAFIGLTIVAIGTSLPELVTSVVASYKGNTDIAVGNVVGSNIFNLLWVLGLSATIRPLDFQVPSNVDILMIILASSLVLVALVVGKGLKIKRIEGAFFLLVYFSYLGYLVMRG